MADDGRCDRTRTADQDRARGGDDREGGGAPPGAHATRLGAQSAAGVSTPGSGASASVSIPSTNALTRRSSSWRPGGVLEPAAAPRARSSALRYGRVVVIAENASPTARIRAISGISSPASRSR